MKIDGRLIASQIKTDLKEKIASLKVKNIIPQLAVILVGNDPSSQTYVRQKQKVGEELGIKISLFKIASAKNTLGEVAEAIKTPRGWQADPFSESDKDTSDGVQSTPPRWRYLKKKLINLVNKLNNDKSVYGIIIQRPVPIDISQEELDLLVISNKDVDGFHPKSPFTPPIASGVIKILEWVFLNSPGRRPADSSEVEEFKKDFINWLKKQKILVIGRGETAGKPIAETLMKMGVKITIAHSKTNNLQKLCLSSDIIITCVGRADVVRHNMLRKDSILIGVGLHQENGKLRTDYNQEEIADKAAYFTPVPGGVGPVNVACLFENLIFATKSHKYLISYETSYESPEVADW